MTQKINLNDFPHEWVELTKSTKGLIIYNDCEMGNLVMTIRNVDGKYQLLLHGTQEDDNFDILEAQQKNDTLKISVLRKAFNQTQVFNFIWLDKQKNIGKWITTYSESGNTVTYLVVDSRFQKDFKSFEQPCIECWGEKCENYD